MADDEHAAVGTVVGEPPPFGGGDDEDFAVLARRSWIGGIDQRLGVRAKKLHQLVELPAFGDVDERLRGLLR